MKEESVDFKEDEEVVIEGRVTFINNEDEEETRLELNPGAEPKENL